MDIASTPWLKKINMNLTNMQFEKLPIPPITHTMKLSLIENMMLG